MWLSILIGALIVCAGLYRIAEAIEKIKVRKEGSNLWLELQKQPTEKNHK